MIIGLLKEIKIDEFRVPLIPEDAKKLIKKGNEIIFEQKCGEMAGYSDEDYIKAGAKLREKDFIFKNANIIVKLKTPQDKEPEKFSKGQILFSYLHYDGNESLEGAEMIRKSGAIAIAFEWVEEDGPKFPLLKPMSELTGTIGAIKSLEIFFKKNRRITGCFNKNIEPITIMIIGLGTIGTNALNVFLHQGIKLIIVDKHPESIEQRALKYVPEYLWHEFKEDIKVIKSNEENVENTKKKILNEFPNVDILFFSAVRRPNFREAHLINKNMLSSMKKNSVIIDAGANDNDLLESSLSYPEIDKMYKVNDVWHYVNDHIPTMAANDASRILSKVILPYLMKLSNGEPSNVILKNSALSKGTVIAGYNYTHEYTCKRKKLQYLPVKEALKQYG